MKRIYYKTEISYTPENCDLIYNTLYLTGISSILDENGLITFFLPTEEYDKIEELKKELLSINGVSEKDISVERFSDHDWNNEWEQSIEPVYIKDKIVVSPSWKTDSIPDKENKIIIIIDPKMSFGTAHNETTQMMLEMMLDYFEPSDKYLLDYGCGTAVLAIAGIKLGVNKALAIDIDSDSIDNAKECIDENHVYEFIDIKQANISDVEESEFDIIIANIDRTVITSNIKLISEKLKKNGKLFITGILIEEEDELVDCLESNNFLIIETRTKAEWLSFYAVKKEKYEN
jgi:ribosomal protein L11 methyltransferase